MSRENDLVPMSPRVGLLPFYIGLYDEIAPSLREGFKTFQDAIRAGLEQRGIVVTAAPICRVAAEFEAAIPALESAGVDCLMTVHLAYSPSLESIDACCRTRLPLVLLDTTMDADFGLAVDPARIMYNHGIHGVMDFASMLRRRERTFEIVAGHVDDPGTLDRAAVCVRGAVAARGLRGGRALRVGRAFAGMGDFAVSEDVLAASFGLRVDEIDLTPLARATAAVTDAAVADEVALDRARFACELDADVHARSVRVGLGLRRLLDEGGYTALSVNFQAFAAGGEPPADTMPFLETAKAMGRGFGYAGEGDVLTANLVGALARAFGAVTFTEVFCPDWAGNRLFLSHMGEVSPAVAGDRPRVLEKSPYPFGARNPAMLTCALRPGPALMVNLAPGPRDAFTLITAPVEVEAEVALHAGLRDCIRGWIRPRGGDLHTFLERYSRAGGTHHSALVLGDAAAAVAAMARFTEVAHVVID